MNIDTYFLPINSNLLSSYIGRCIILPRKYLSEQIMDIQCKYPDSLLLSKSKWIWKDDTIDCSLELVMTDEEQKKLISRNSYYLYPNALPLTRVKNIFFKTEEQKKKTIYNIEHGDGFVPKIIKIDSSNDYGDLEFPSEPTPVSSNEILINIQRFDQLLGAFACMHLAGQISSQYRSNFSENYFATLGAINNVIRQDCEFAKFQTKSNLLGVFLPEHQLKWNEFFLRILRSSPRGEDDFRQQLIDYSKSTKNDAIISAIKSSLGVNWDFLKDSFSFALVLLFRYGQSKRKSTTDLFNDLINNKIPAKDKAESLLFLYGYHYGYTQFRNREFINDSEVDIKFRMDSQLDYFTIESIYQCVFNNQINNDDFEYLVQWCPKLDSSKEVKFPLIIDMPVWGLEARKESPILKIAEKIVSFFLSGEKSKYSSTTFEQMQKEAIDGVTKILQEEDYSSKVSPKPVVLEENPVPPIYPPATKVKKAKGGSQKSKVENNLTDKKEKPVQGELL